MQKPQTHLTQRTMFALAALVIAPLSVESGYGQQSGDTLLAQETIRRQEMVIKSDTLLSEGRKAYAQEDYETAVQKYREALGTLPYGTATNDRRASLTQHLNDGSVALTQKYRLVGKYKEARDLLEEVEKNDPGSIAAQEGLEYLDDTIRTETSLTHEHTENVEGVRRSLYKGESFYSLGVYDKAEEEFKQVLRIDPYNKAARRWLERCAAIKSDYYRASYDQTRAEMLMKVDQAWELAVPPLGDGPRPDLIIDPTGDGERSIIAKLNQIMIPELKLNNSTVEEAVEYLRLR
ncbi:MAG: general secretion pathway protein D, partial [Akkermansiaceae bacterium]